MEEEDRGCFRVAFRSFVCLTLTALLGLQIYGYWSGQVDSIEGDFSDIKYVVMQLTRGLSEVNRKHDHLVNEMERISAELPGVIAAASRAKDALQPSRRFSGQSVEVLDYDRQIGDFALESAGARILDTGDTVEHALHDSIVGQMLYVFSTWMCRGQSCFNARAMLRPGALPGECWAFKGARGEAIIRLLGTVHITGVSLEHIPSHISPTKEISSAPRLFQLEGLDYRNDPYPHDFGKFEYNQEGKSIQYFEVRHPAPRAYNLVRLRVLSNWGHPVYTCVYRLRVHGNLAGGQAPRATPPSDDDARIDIE